MKKYVPLIEAIISLLAGIAGLVGLYLFIRHRDPVFGIWTIISMQVAHDVDIRGRLRQLEKLYENPAL